MHLVVALKNAVESTYAGAAPHVTVPVKTGVRTPVDAFCFHKCEVFEHPQRQMRGLVQQLLAAASFEPDSEVDYHLHRWFPATGEAVTTVGVPCD
jgi:hypothetical protein